MPTAAQTDQATLFELADSSRYLTCHDVIETIRGPAWQEVAKCYRGKAEIEYLRKN